MERPYCQTTHAKETTSTSDHRTLQLFLECSLFYLKWCTALQYINWKIYGLFFKTEFNISQGLRGLFVLLRVYIVVCVKCSSLKFYLGPSLLWHWGETRAALQQTKIAQKAPLSPGAPVLLCQVLYVFLFYSLCRTALQADTPPPKQPLRLTQAR